MPRGRKPVKTSKYKHVSFSTRDNAWIVQIGKIYKKNCETERQAAIEADKFLLSIGKPAVNILKPKQ